jgi:hypothetical protein
MTRLVTTVVWLGTLTIGWRDEDKRLALIRRPRIRIGIGGECPRQRRLLFQRDLI